MFRIPDTAPLLNSRRMGAAVAACLSAAALMAGCGGGDRVQHFVPQQIIAFGDENSAFDDTSDSGTPLVAFGGTAIRGSRYTINLLADASFYCITNAPTASAACTSDAEQVAVPTATSFFVPLSTAYTYRTSSGTIPVVLEVATGYFTETGVTPPTVYNSTDHLYYCSVGFGNFIGNWVQVLAHDFGNGLSLGGNAGCPQDGGNGRSYATWGAKVDDVETQVNANIGALRDGVLVTVLAGQNDILTSWDNVRAGGDQVTALRLMREKGAKLGRIINTIVGTGARVVYLTVPDMGKTPKAQYDANLGTALTKAFNNGYEEAGGLELTVKTDGHKIVKVDGFTQINNMFLSGSYVTAGGACQTDPTKVKMANGTPLATAIPAVTTDANLRAKALLLNCTSNNLVKLSGDFTATPPTNELRVYFGNYLWADDSRLGPIGHNALGALAVARVRDQL